LRKTLAALAAASLLSAAPWAGATVVATTLAAPLFTAPNPGGGCCDGTGVWFNPLNGYADTRGFFFPDPLYEDGKFFLLLNTSQPTAQAQVFVQGFFSRGNGVIYASSSNLNPGRYGVGTSIGAGTGYQSPGAGFPDLGPLFGNWGPGRGFLGLTMRDASGASASDVFYGYADITIGSDYVITLNGFAYENVRGAAITTAFLTAVPEAGSGTLMALGLAGLLGVRRLRR